MVSSIWSLKWSALAFFGLVLVIAFLELKLCVSRRKIRTRKVFEEAGRLGLTPKALEYKNTWSKEVNEMVSARAREIAKKNGVDIVDDSVMKQAILEVMHQQWVAMSSRR